jgi:hypothetical protein
VTNVQDGKQRGKSGTQTRKQNEGFPNKSSVNRIGAKIERDSVGPKYIMGEDLRYGDSSKK